MFTKTEYQFIERKAKDYSRPVSEFLKECVFSYLNNRFMIHDPNLYRAILLEIRRVGNNVNQISKIANTNKKINAFETLQVSRGVKEIETLVKNSLQNPPELLGELSKAITDPYFLYLVEVLIYNHKIKNDCKVASMEKA